MSPRWIPISERLPPPGKLVPVHGRYTPTQGKPLSYRVADDDPRSAFGLWHSTEWRGIVAIEYWWEEKMWNIRCLARVIPESAVKAIPPCPFFTNDLVAMQEHAMTAHSASHEDVRKVNSQRHDEGHYEYTSANGRVHFEAKRNEEARSRKAS